VILVKKIAKKNNASKYDKQTTQWLRGSNDRYGVFGRTNLLREHALPLANHVDCVIDLS
jgi:hypothetical protein